MAFSFCLYLFRNCELRNTSDPSSGLQLSICQSKCSGLSEIGVECINESDLQTLLEISNYNEIIAWALNFSCYDPMTYTVPGVPISNTSCDNISFIDGLLPGEVDIHIFAVHTFLVIIHDAVIFTSCSFL